MDLARSAQQPALARTEPGEDWSQGVKHLVPCQCVLPQLKARPGAPLHSFVVFSLLDPRSGRVQTKLAQCNNCGRVHRVTDLCTSSILAGKEESRGVLTVEDLRGRLPDKLAALLVGADADLATWEECAWKLAREEWGAHVTISRESEGGERTGKYVRIVAPDMFYVETYCEQSTI